MTGVVLSLPAELLHAIFARLPLESVLFARRTCRLFAKVGEDYMLEEVVTFYKRSALQKLVDIANHPVLSHRVKRLHWRAERLKHALPFQLWNYHRQPRKRDSTKTPQLAYQDYLTLRNDQDQIHRERFDMHCLSYFFQHCQNLSHVKLSIGCTSASPDGTAPSVFSDVLILPTSDPSVLDQGKDQFTSLVEALDRSHCKLRGLAIHRVSHRVLATNAALQSSVLNAMHSLRELRLDLNCYSRNSRVIGLSPSAQVLREDVEGYLPNGMLKGWLESASCLETLKICGTNGWLLEDILPGDKVLAKLCNIGLSMIAIADERGLASFLLRHASTLRKVFLSEISLTRGSWQKILDLVAGRLPKLRTVKLDRIVTFIPANFDEEADQTWYDNQVLQWHEYAEEYLVHGGSCPKLESLLEWNGEAGPPRDMDMSFAPRRDEQGQEQDGYVSDRLDDSNDDFDKYTELGR